MKNCNFFKTVLHHRRFPGSIPKFSEQPFCRMPEDSSLSIWSLFWILEYLKGKRKKDGCLNVLCSFVFIITLSHIVNSQENFSSSVNLLFILCYILSIISPCFEIERLFCKNLAVFFAFSIDKIRRMSLNHVDPCLNMTQ